MLIKFQDLIRKYKIQPKGVFHVGANDGQEALYYYGNGVERTLWVEAIPEVHDKLKAVIRNYPNAISFQACITEDDFKSVKFNVSSNKGESSSLLDFGTHKYTYPDITFTKQIELTTIRLDTLVSVKGVDISEYDFLNIDVQGAELMVLKSLGGMIRNFRSIYVEVNREEVYKGCPLINDITTYLGEHGFELKEVKWSQHGNWGDAYYQRKHTDYLPVSASRKYIDPRLKNYIVAVPPKFMTGHPFPYPPDNHKVFEQWFYENFDEGKERVYLPVQWTGYLVTHSFGNDTIAINELQEYIDSLDRSKKYYTIHQFDLGCMVDFKDLDILVFGMSGGRIDYCLPLLCTPHKFEFNNSKTLFASFVGRPTHSVRKKMMDGIKNKQGCYISDAHHDLSAYCSILSSSVFGLAPRGFGRNSFRIAESLQYGAIPVIISDNRLEPHGIPFEEYGVYIDEKDAANVYEILQAISKDEIRQKQLKVSEIYKNYFTYEANKRLIMGVLDKV